MAQRTFVQDVEGDVVSELLKRGLMVVHSRRRGRTPFHLLLHRFITHYAGQKAWGDSEPPGVVLEVGGICTEVDVMNDTVHAPFVGVIVDRYCLSVLDRVLGVDAVAVVGCGWGWWGLKGWAGQHCSGCLFSWLSVQQPARTTKSGGWVAHTHAVVEAAVSNVLHPHPDMPACTHAPVVPATIWIPRPRLHLYEREVYTRERLCPVPVGPIDPSNHPSPYGPAASQFKKSVNQPINQ
jgi:hypothetical protein